MEIEPREGEYRFGWLDDIIDLCSKYNFKVILGTPTDSMPAWLAEKYPGALAEKEDGTRVVWGGRKNNCYSDDDFNRLSRKIAAEMAMHYKDNDTVIGWQTGNEYGPPESRSKKQQIAFQEYLREKFKTLDNLNEKWGNAFWGHTFTEWEQIPVPLYWRFNPSMSLEWKRFHTAKICEHQQLQIDEIRKHCPGKFITHNLIGHHTVLDYYRVAREIDFVSWDNYPIEKADSIMIKASLCGDLMRGIKKKNYWIMEQATGMISVMWEGMKWEQYRNAYKDELRKIAFQQLAHGADGMLWFRWRATTTGREQYLSGLLGQNGKPGRRYADIQRATLDFRKIENEVEGTTLKPKTAILFDYESSWATWFTPVYKQNDYFERILMYYRGLFNAGVNADVIHPDSDLSVYNLVLAPNLVLLSDENANKLNRFVQNGGILLSDGRTGEKDEYNHIYERELPGILSQSLGIRIEDISCMYDDMYYPVTTDEKFDHKKYSSHQYCEWVKPVEAETILQYNSWQMEGSAVLTRNNYGKGYAWYVSTIIRETEFYDKLLKLLVNEAGITPVIKDIPNGVEVVIREDEKKQLIFVINHNENKQSLTLPFDADELLSGKIMSGEIEIERFGIRVFKVGKKY